MSESYTLITADAVENVRRLDVISRTCSAELLKAEKAGDSIARGLIAGAAMNQMRELMTDDVMRSLMPIVGTALGMKTDRQYSTQQVRDAVLEGLLKGARVVGNEINILGGNLYLTREYWERRFREIDGVTDVREPTISLPRAQKLGDKEYAICSAKLEYRVDGKIKRTECLGEAALVVVWNKTDRIETIHGKIKKRLYAIAYADVMGTAVDLDDEPEAGVTAAAWTDDDDEPTSELELARRSCLSRIDGVRDLERLENLKSRWGAFIERVGIDYPTDATDAASRDVDKAYQAAKRRLSN